MTPEEVVLAIQDNPYNIESGETFLIGEMYCPQCGGARRMHADPLYCRSRGSRSFGAPLPPHITNQFSASTPNFDAHVPALFRLQCGQCDAVFTLLLYEAREGAGLAILPSGDAGFATPKTSPPVRYYIDQAARAHSVGANAAAIAMFRAALEALLFEQGFESGMLGAKIEKLEAAITSRTAPKWALGLEPEFLKVIKNLGNAAIHAGSNPDVKQQAIDAALYVRVAETLQELLEEVYEAEPRKAERLAKLRSTEATLRK